VPQPLVISNSTQQAPSSLLSATPAQVYITAQNPHTELTVALPALHDPLHNMRHARLHWKQHEVMHCTVAFLHTTSWFRKQRTPPLLLWRHLARSAMQSSKIAQTAAACDLHACCSQARKQLTTPCPSIDRCHSKVSSQKQATVSQCSELWGGVVAKSTFIVLTRTWEGGGSPCHHCRRNRSCPLHCGKLQPCSAQPLARRWVWRPQRHM
jgi:hypothetical protein